MMHINQTRIRDVGLLRSASAFALALAASLCSNAAFAQGAPASATVEEVVVTGTSIRGVAPVGSNLISVGREAIESTSAQTLQQILKSVPSITGAGAAAEGFFVHVYVDRVTRRPSSLDQSLRAALEGIVA